MSRHIWRCFDDVQTNQQHRWGRECGEETSGYPKVMGLVLDRPSPRGPTPLRLLSLLAPVDSQRGHLSIPYRHRNRSQSGPLKSQIFLELTRDSGDIL